MGIFKLPHKNSQFNNDSCSMATSVKTYYLIDTDMNVDIDGGRQITEYMT
jgi:hypothetical protein